MYFEIPGCFGLFQIQKMKSEKVNWQLFCTKTKRWVIFINQNRLNCSPNVKNIISLKNKYVLVESFFFQKKCEVNHKMFPGVQCLYYTGKLCDSLRIFSEKIILVI